ncbi:MAG: hypothetical protein RBT49_02235 [Bacteroidales bacterium]|jgi:hypothetical protein|nr:hypothetical protein [Bacteroidales bacterium]
MANFDFDGSGDVLAIGEGWEDPVLDALFGGTVGDINIIGIQSNVLTKKSDGLTSLIVAKTFRKRLHYIVDKLIPSYLLNENPEWKLLMEIYLKYLDERVFQKVINIQNIVNINSEETDDALTQGLYEQYGSGLVNEDILKIEMYDKKKFAQLGKYFHNIKGTKLSLEYLFKYLSQSQVIGLEEKKVFEYILEEVREDKNLLNIDDEPNPRLFIAPFTYNIVANEVFSELPLVLKTVHPAGFNFLILYEDVFLYTETITFGSIEGEINKMYPYRYDGMYNRMGYYVGTEQSYPIQIKPMLYSEGFTL